MDFMLDLNLLRAVTVIMSTRSLTAAAEELHCSQSALSHQISKWERHTGMKLFDRRKRPLEPTPVGLLLAERAERIQELLADTSQALQVMQESERNRLFITLECHTCIEWLAPTLDRYRQEQPDIHLDLRMGASFDPVPSITAHATDLIVTAEPDTTSARRSDHALTADPLFRYPIVGLLRQDHPLAERPFLTPADFLNEAVITYPVAECRLDLYTRFLEPAGVVPKERRTAELTTMIVQWVIGGVGLAALPRWALPKPHPDLAMVPLGPDGLWADLFAVRRSEDRGLAHLDAFVALAHNECFATLDGIVPVPT
jgi:LysR family transcriptional regulator for metE and metH